MSVGQYKLHIKQNGYTITNNIHFTDDHRNDMTNSWLNDGGDETKIEISRKGVKILSFDFRKCCKYNAQTGNWIVQKHHFSQLRASNLYSIGGMLQDCICEDDKMISVFWEFTFRFNGTYLGVSSINLNMINVREIREYDYQTFECFTYCEITNANQRLTRIVREDLDKGIIKHEVVDQRGFSYLIQYNNLEHCAYYCRILIVFDEKLSSEKKKLLVNFYDKYYNERRIKFRNLKTLASQVFDEITIVNYYPKNVSRILDKWEVDWETITKFQQDN